MQASRREIIKTAIAAGGAATLGGGASAASQDGAKLIHHVFFWLKNPGSRADREALIAGLRGLAKIPVVRSLQIGVPASTEQRAVVESSFDVSELMVFDSVADQKAYQDHPLHLSFVARCSPLWRKVTVYDVTTI